MAETTLSISVCGLSILIETDERSIIVEVPDYRTMQELEDNIRKVLEKYNLKPVND